jgi:phage baseplate assembly protein gpV
VRNGEEYRQNQQIRRGIVIDRDPKKMKAKVQFEDEDDVVTQWIDAGANSSTGVSFFHMPGMGDEVWCAMDAKGEAGCIISSKYNAKDKPPADSNDIVALKWGWRHLYAGHSLGCDHAGNPRCDTVQSLPDHSRW